LSDHVDSSVSTSSRLHLEADVENAVARLCLLIPDNSTDPRHRLLAALVDLWDDEPPDTLRLDAARALLTLDQRDVWFLSRNDPVEALDSAASKLLVALGDAITAAGANFSFYSREPFTPAEEAEIAYAELGEALAHWKNEALNQQRRGASDHADAPVDDG
jgi:hypothetical protein